MSKDYSFHLVVVATLAGVVLAFADPAPSNLGAVTAVAATSPAPSVAVSPETAPLRVTTTPAALEPRRHRHDRLGANVRRQAKERRTHAPAATASAPAEKLS